MNFTTLCTDIQLFCIGLLHSCSTRASKGLLVCKSQHLKLKQPSLNPGFFAVLCSLSEPEQALLEHICLCILAQICLCRDKPDEKMLQPHDIITQCKFYVQWNLFLKSCYNCSSHSTRADLFTAGSYKFICVYVTQFYCNSTMLLYFEITCL